MGKGAAGHSHAENGRPRSMKWAEESRRVIGEVHASLPADATLDQRKAALKAAYPFGERKHWPYEAWLKAKRNYLRQFGDRPVVSVHRSPMERMIAKSQRTA